MNKIVNFFSEVSQEIKKISWANKKETKYSVITIFVSVAILASFFLLADMIIYEFVNFVLNVGSN